MQIKNKIIFTCLFLIHAFSVSAQAADSIRSLDELFPDLTENQRQEAFDTGGIRNTFFRHETPLYVPSPSLGVDLMGSILKRVPAQFIEALIVIPRNERQLDKLDIYNAVMKIENIKNYIVHSQSRNKMIRVFEESSQIEIPNRNSPIPDPPPASILPASQTIFVRVKDSSFGTTYFRGEFSADSRGITYRLINTAAIWFLIFPVMGAEKFAMSVYVEPIKEGILIYGMAGIDIPMFIASSINIAEAIDMRVKTVVNWLCDNLNSQN
ncbi:MAG: hypothetical protein FWB73_03420 [Treponema sp.]|nr:hypothetical protein [Treponema sp.]